MHGAGIVLGLAILAFAVRCVLVVVLRPTSPRAAEVVDRSWIWFPMAAIIVGVALWSLPIAVVVAAVSLAIVARDPRVDLPFRRSR
jgi:hypothetical protein